MSKKRLWLTMVWAEHKDLIIVGIIVVAVSVLGLFYARTDPVGWAQVLVLGITALAVVWYAHEARRMADETRRLATSTQRMASGAWRPNVMFRTKTREYPAGLFNYGPGPARNLWIVASHLDSPQLKSRDQSARCYKLLSSYVPPNHPVYIPTEAEGLLKWSAEKEAAERAERGRQEERGVDLVYRRISLFWLDNFGQDWAIEWRWSGKHWIPEGEPPEDDWKIWRDICNST